MSLIEQLLSVALPGKGGFVMDIAEIYLDGSEVPDVPLLCVAGYIFTKENRIQLDEEWAPVLAFYELPFFRMSACAHGNWPFDKLSPTERIEVQMKCFEILKRYVSCGFAATIELKHEAMLPYGVGLNGASIGQVTPYALCCYFALHGANKWADTNNPDGEIAYFFESGNKHYGQASRIMNEIFTVPFQRKHFRYASHGFIPKEKSAGVQCADILAWQWGKHNKDAYFGKSTPRKDMQSLMELNGMTIHFDKNTIADFLAQNEKVNARVAEQTSSGSC